MNVIPLGTMPRKAVIACLTDHPKAIMLLRMARRRAQAMDASWRAVFIETPATQKQIDTGAHERMLRLLTMAEQMGGEAVHFAAETVEDGLKSLLEKDAATIALVVIGRVKPEGRFSSLRMLPWMRMVQSVSQYAQVEIVPLSAQYHRKNASELLQQYNIRPVYFIYAILSVYAAFLIASLLEWALPPALFRINNQNVALLFMIACAFVAGRFGLLPGMVAAVAGFMTVNYCFTVPYHEHLMSLNTVTDVLNMGLFLGAAVLISLFSSQGRDYAKKVARREMSTQALFSLYRIASETFSTGQALEKLQQKLEPMLDMDVAFFLPSALQPDRVEPAFPKNLALDEADNKAIEVCWANLQTTGVAAPYNPGTKWRFEPMVAPTGEMGVLGARPRSRKQIDAWFGRLFLAIADQTAGILEHIKLEHSMENTRIGEEREKLRSMLLSSISHDFKTPIAGIVGALSVHRSLGNMLSQEKRNELIESAIEEAQRLDSFITNILDMTRLENGNIQFKQEWHDIESMVTNVTKRMQHRLRQHVLTVSQTTADIEVYMDVIMTSQVLQNLLDNACKYTPPGSKIEISCRLDEEKGVLCSVRDHGNGLPPEKINRVFDKYERLYKKDLQVAGTGLGLAIGKAVIEAQGGWINAANHPQGGAVFTFCLPQWRKAMVIETREASSL